MRVDHLYWDTVTVECPSDQTKATTFGRSLVTYSALDKSLLIQEVGRFIECREERSSLYARASVVSITPDEVVFEACWWSCPFGEPDKATLIPVRVTCRF